jgi:hypothetical protein
MALNILLVDESDESDEMASAMRYGIKTKYCLEVVGYSKVVEILSERNNLHLIFINIPRGKANRGLETVRKIKEINRHVSTVLVFWHGNKFLREACEEEGYIFLLKPHYNKSVFGYLRGVKHIANFLNAVRRESKRVEEEELKPS